MRKGFHWVKSKTNKKHENKFPVLLENKHKGEYAEISKKQREWEIKQRQNKCKHNATTIQNNKAVCWMCGKSLK